MKLVKLLLCNTLLLVGCGNESSAFTPSQVNDAREFCAANNTELHIVTVEYSSGSYIKKLYCIDKEKHLYQLELIYNKHETTDCGRMPSPCFRTDYNNPQGLRFKTDD